MKGRCSASTIALASLLCLIAPSISLYGEETPLEQIFALESRLLDSSIDRYRTVREEERALLADLATRSEEAESALVAPLEVEALWAGERRVEAARARLVAASEEVARHRRAIYSSLERLDELGTSIQRRKDRQLVQTEKLDGRWRLEIASSGELGLMDLRLDGTLVTGAYRLSSGAQGSLRGTYANHWLDLERVDTVRGLDMKLAGAHDPETGEIEGTWETIGPTEVSGRAGARDALTGAPAPHRDVLAEEDLPNLLGQWTAHKISPGDEHSSGPESR